MTLQSFVLIVLSVFLSAVAQIAFKFGLTTMAASRTTAIQVFDLLSPAVLGGLSLYLIGTILWLNALQEVPLSQAYPFVSLGFALTTIAGWWLFGDVLSAQRLIGIAVIFTGILLVARS